RVSVTWDGPLAPQQFVFSGRDSSGEVLAPVSRPSSPSTTPLPNGSTLLVELKDSLAGQVVVIHVDALVNNQVAASGDSGPTPLVRGHEVDLSVTLLPAGIVPEGGPMDAGATP